MAGDWIKWIDGLERKREVVAMALALKPTGNFAFDCDIVAARWMKVWAWSGRETTDGHIPSVTREVVDDVAGLPGFLSAAETVGWATAKAGGVSFINWAKHNGKSEKARADAAERQRRHRESPPCHENVTVDRDMSRDREEKRREDFKTKPPDAAHRPPRGARIAAGWTPDSGFTGISPAMRQAWAQAYPSVSIDSELAKAHAWLVANPGRAGKRNWAKFLTNWLARTHERGPGLPGIQTPPASKYETDNERSMRLIRERAGAKP